MVASGNYTVNIIDIQTLLVSLTAVTQRSSKRERCVTSQKKRLRGRLYFDAFKESCFLILTEKVGM